MKAGDWVLATRKSIYSNSFHWFLEEYPLGVVQLKHIFPDHVIVGRKGEYSFKEEDLILLKSNE